MARRTDRGAIRTVDLVAGVGIVVCLAYAIFFQNRTLSDAEQIWERYEQRMVLPSGQVLDFLTLGYDQIYTDWLWLNSIQAFGRGWITEDMSTRPIFDYFDTLTDLDPRFINAYRFGNLIIGDNRLDWDLGQEILVKGTLLNINNYDIPYLGVYNAIFHADKPEQARWFAVRLMNIPDAPTFMRRFKGYIETREGRYEAAFDFNLRYLMEYIATGNDVERPIVLQRMRQLLDQWNRREMDAAVDRYLARYAEHPTRMEDLLVPGVRPDFEAPTMNTLVRAVENHIEEIERLVRGAEVPQELVDQVTRESRTRIVGLPPEPSGTWYMIHDYFQNLYFQNALPDTYDKGKYGYIIAAADLLTDTNLRAARAQRFILNYHAENNETLPPDSEMEQFYGRDPFNGHYVYDRDAPESPTYGVFYSTAARRIDESLRLPPPQRTEPRVGLAGPGPFPFTIQPRLSDIPEEYLWGLANGYILPDGTELWPEEKQALDGAGSTPSVPDIPTTTD